MTLEPSRSRWKLLALVGSAAAAGVVFGFYRHAIPFAILKHWTRLEGLLTCLCGIYVTLMAKGVLPRNPKNPQKLELWRQKFGEPLKIAGPIVIGFGVLQFLGAFDRAKPLISKEDIEALPEGGSLREAASGLTITLHRKQAGTPDESGWYPAQSTGCGFKILLPGPFNDFTQEDLTPDRAVVKMHGVGMRTAEGIRFSVFCIEGGTKDSPSNYLAAALKAAAGLEVLKRTVVHVGPHDGTRVTAKVGSTVSDIEAFLIGERAYQLSVEYPVSEASYMPAICDRFFGSFRP